MKAEPEKRDGRVHLTYALEEKPFVKIIKVVREGVSKEEAEEVKKKLEEAGATVTVE